MVVDIVAGIVRVRERVRVRARVRVRVRVRDVHRVMI
jgi:hypothetical protein